MLTARYTHAAAVLNGAIHIVGGADLSTCSVMTTHEVYDPVADAWSSLAPMSTPRAHPGAAVLNDGSKDLLYVVGGASACSVKADTMEAYDPATNSWTAKASMPGGGRNSMGVAVIDNRLYVVGGIKSGEVVTEIGEVYNPVTDTWSPIAPMPSVRYAMAVGAIDGILYAAGGGNNIANFTAVDAYDPATNTWSSRAPMSTQRAYVASAVVDGLLYAIGGQNSLNLSSVEIYDPATDSWSAGPALPAARSLMPAVNVAGRIYLTGGGYTNAGGLFGDTLMLIDVTAPVTTATLSPTPNGNGWNNSDPVVTLSATPEPGGSGAAAIVYSLTGAQSGGATITGNSTAFAITSEGTTTVTYHAVDAVGNAEADRQLVVHVDKTNPTLPGLPNVTANATSSAGAIVTFSVVASDVLSGVVSTQFSPKSSGMTFPPGITHETVTVTDAAGNVAVGGFDVTVNPLKTLVSVEVSPSSASVTQGQNQQFQAIGHFSDGTTQALLSGNGGGGGLPTGPSNPSWSVQMTPPINVDACATAQFPGPLVFSSQGFFDQSGLIHTTWSPGTPVVSVDGSITPSTVSLSLACTNGPATGTISAAWTGTRYEGTYSFNGGASAGAVSITGWSPQAPMPASRFSHAAASVNGNVYVFGGGNPGQSSPVLKYLPGANAWSTLGNMPTSREGLAAATINGLIYVVGGHVSGGIASGVLEAYDAATGTWTALAPMPTPRAHLAAVTDGTYLYALGGDTAGSNSGVVATVERYDPVANSWSALASMPAAGNFVVAGVLNNTIVVAGAGNSSNTDVYDIATDMWHSGPPMPAGRSLAAAGVANGGMYVVGGTVNGSPMYPTWVYYPATNQAPDYWSGPASILTARSQLAVAVVDDVVYAIGGMAADSNPPTEFATTEALSTPPAYTFSPFSGGGNSTPTVQWQSSNPSVAGIDNSGNAHANAVGQVTIVAVASTGISCASANSCATLNVIDNTPPNVFAPPNRTVEANNPGGANNVNFFVSSFDNADGARQVSCTWSGGSATFFPPSFSQVTRFFPFGTTTVSCSAADSSGNTGHASFTITVRDTVAPFLNVPSQFMTTATSASGAIVNFLGPVSAFDSVDGQVTPSCAPSTGSNFPIGSTPVSCTATDAHGNTSLPKTFNVQVNDRLTLNLPANIVAEATSAAGVAVPFSVSATYFLGGTEPVQCFIITGFVGGDPQVGPPVSSGATFPVGTTTVGCLANYPSGGHVGGFFTVSVTLLTPQQIIAKLAAQAAAINYDQGSGLLQNALANLNAGSVSDACNQLGAYINQIQAQIGKKISAADAAALIQLVNAARVSMGC